MIVDAYSHVCPERLLDAINERHPGAEVAALRKNSYLFDGERRLRYMDRIGVDKQVLVLVRPPMWLGMPRPLIHDLTRVANDSIAEMAAKWPDRFIPVGVLPVVDDEMMAEFGRLHGDLGVRGVLIFSNVEGRPLDDDSMWPLYAEADSAGVPIWIHPQHGHSYPWLKRDLVDRLFGWPFETTLAMSRLVFGGVLERYPDLKFVTHHLGGMVPYYASRADAMTHEIARYRDASLTEASQPLPGRPTDYFRKFYNDSMVNGSAAAMRCGLDFFGSQHVMYGTDFPMGPNAGETWPVQVLDTIRSLDLGAADLEDVLAGNLRRLIRL
ncbi:MAG TPA: amidohydrolase family protein [Streptosporangiaceae bacterium]|nr:amidohydrolase family protein [Streptosporangiaceae bacterium]